MAEKSTPPPRTDGRAERSAATRRAVAEAYLHLIEAGDLRPTARTIAARAGVSERAVFRHFRDMESLLAESARIQIGRLAGELPAPAPATAVQAERILALARRWSGLHERVGPVRRVALLYEPFSSVVAGRLAWIRGVIRAEIEGTFAAELEGRSDEARRRIVAALCAACSWETWNELRTRQQLDHPAAEATLVDMIGALLSGMAGGK